jgi:2-polyprenyl-6-methoxyphenol hydroxylase-like FAD-dependent oxidoreductase
LIAGAGLVGAVVALQATQRGERITHQLLVFSRRQVLRPETLNLNPHSPDEALILSALSPILI